MFSGIYKFVLDKVYGVRFSKGLDISASRRRVPEICARSVKPVPYSE